MHHGDVYKRQVYMFGLRAPELIIILVVVLIIFGPKNLPKLGKSLGHIFSVKIKLDKHLVISLY